MLEFLMLTEEFLSRKKIFSNFFWKKVSITISFGILSMFLVFFDMVFQVTSNKLFILFSYGSIFSVYSYVIFLWIKFFLCMVEKKINFIIFLALILLQYCSKFSIWYFWNGLLQDFIFDNFLYYVEKIFIFFAFNYLSIMDSWWKFLVLFFCSWVLFSFASMKLDFFFNSKQ
jgi:hypothetical protein